MGVGKQIANNVVWKSLELFAVTGIQFISTFVMARFLQPDDYGVMGLVTVFTAFANVIIDSGFGQALIREKEVTRTDYSTILYFNILISVLLYALFFIFSGDIAAFFNKPILGDVCKITFLVLLFNALSIVQITKIQRDVKFKKLCCISLLSSLLASGIAVYIAYVYRNVWALVVQNILIYFFKMFFMWITTDFVPVVKFSLSSLKKYLAFSKDLMLSSIIGTVFNNVYSLVIGKVYSATDLGYYSQAERLSNLGSQTTTHVIHSVIYPFLSKINNENGGVKEGYRKIMGITLIFVGSVMALLMGCAPDLFEFLMGNEVWRLAGVYFVLIGINGILHPLHSINQNILMVKGESKTILYLEILRRFIMVVILVVTMQFGIMVFVAGLTFYSILQLFVNMYFCGRPIGYGVVAQLKDHLPIFARLLVMIVTSLLVGYMLSSVPLFVRLVITIVTGIVCGLVVFWGQSDFKTALSILVTLVRKRD